MPEEKHPFEVDIGSLVEVLQGNLYSNPRIAFREILSNARDSMIKRWGTTPPPDARIELHVDLPNRSLSIRDSGTGMDEQEVRNGMARVAGSTTRLLRRQSNHDNGAADWVSGFFGLGFFASFMLAKGVDVKTKVPSAEGKALLWRCYPGGNLEAQNQRIPASWTLKPVAWDGQGTEVTLYLKPEFWDEFLSRQTIEAHVTHFVDLVEFPICFKDSDLPINGSRPPWMEENTPPQGYEDYLRGRGLLDEDHEILTLLPIRERRFSGVLFLAKPGDPVGKIELHVRHIFVNQDSNYLEEPLSFICGIIDHQDLPLTLSRETVIEGDCLSDFRGELRALVVDHLTSLADTRQADLEAVVRAYGRHLKRAAVDDEELLKILGSQLSVPTGFNSRPTYLNELKDQPQVIYMDNPARQGQYAALWEAQGIPVVNASDRLDLMLLHRFFESSETSVVRADTNPKIDETHEPGWEDVEHLVGLQADNAQVKQAKLPEDIPALFEHTIEDVLTDLVNEVSESGRELPDRIAKFAEFHKTMSTLGENRKELFLNVRNPLVLALRGSICQGESTQVLESVARALVAIAQLLTEHVDASERAKTLRYQSEALTALLERRVTGGS